VLRRLCFHVPGMIARSEKPAGCGSPGGLGLT
jgi:hypothetical protein